MSNNVIHTADKESKLYTKRVLIDFDGVIRATGGEFHGEPVPHTEDAIKKLKEMGYEVYVFSTRAAHGQESYIYEWLEQWGIEVDGITGLKLQADFYIDDRAIPFFGDWYHTLDIIDLCNSSQGNWNKAVIH